jgi:hypothetical protein
MLQENSIETFEDQENLKRELSIESIEDSLFLFNPKSYTLEIHEIIGELWKERKMLE